MNGNKNLKTVPRGIEMMSEHNMQKKTTQGRHVGLDLLPYSLASSSTFVGLVETCPTHWRVKPWVLTDLAVKSSYGPTTDKDPDVSRFCQMHCLQFCMLPPLETLWRLRRCEDLVQLVVLWYVT